MASRRNSRYHIVMFVCSRYIITICTSIRATSLYTKYEGERRWLPEGIQGITLLCLSVVDILLLSVPVSELPVYMQKMKERGDGSPEGIPGITLLCLSVVDILLLSVPVCTYLFIYRGEGIQEFNKSYFMYVCICMYWKYVDIICNTSQGFPLFPGSTRQVKDLVPEAWFEEIAGKTE